MFGYRTSDLDNSNNFNLFEENFDNISHFLREEELDSGNPDCIYDNVSIYLFVCIVYR